ncbi:MAG: threonylcarbamoyl-AMP synthase [Bacteroidia bacterium]|nr:threonylcarbamoyl-AMP synthase [Bacteroidia bacterium]MCZ2276838.1 threonylcarbamoyl-AMP synthase [Bacteroidia bacterium]
MKQLIEQEAQHCAEIIKQGGIILYPTDTIWGLGCDATNTQAVKRICQIKQRDENKSLIVLVESENKLLKYVKQIPEMAWPFLEFSVRPITIIYPGAMNLSALVISKDGSVGIRIPRHEFCNRLMVLSGRPLVSTSANISGHPAPVCFDEIPESIKSKADYIVNLENEKKKKGIPSVILKIELNGTFRFLRK